MNEKKRMLGESYLTVAQAAAQLGVHPSTIRRWIDAGLLRAYRLGPKRIAVKQTELERVVVPRSGRIGDGAEERKAPGRMTKAEQQRGLKALAEIDKLRAKLAAKYGKSDIEGWQLLDEAREERTRELMRAVDG